VATDARCPHGGYLMVDARVVRGSVECPRHGYRFRADGRCANVRRARCADVLEVREADGYLWVAV
jgi:phenylpropionate dioxygenase-like ring-hydroxylating dioxygenase large terminal subunit